jgi:hypothetical protein
LLQGCKTNERLFEAFAIEMDRLPFEKRVKVPLIEQTLIDIATNYIGVTKALLSEDKIFPNVKPIPYEQCYACNRELLRRQNVNSLVGLMICLQENSKDAFSQGDITVHRLYLEMADIIKEIYISYQHENWWFPSDILVYIPISYFSEIADDIKTEVKKTLFTMVESINQDTMPTKLIFKDGHPQKEKVSRSEYLQVILYFLEECHAE